MGLFVPAAVGAGEAIGKHMEGKEAPPPPDFRGAAEQQGASSRNDFSSPFGNTQWQQGKDGRWHMTSGFGGPLDGAASGLQQQAADAFGSPLDLGSLGELGNGDAARQEAIDAAYGQATSRLDPQFAQREEQLSAQLANQGLTVGSEAYSNALRDFGQQRNDAYGSAMNHAQMMGQAAGDSVFRNNLAARGQGLAELLRQRGQPLEEMMGLQALQNPSFMLGGQSDATQYLPGAIAGGNYGLTATQMNNQVWADLFSGGGEAIQGGASLLPFLLGGG